jgi:CubicO group peptidase (beta-lactamase class C family)
MTCSHVRKSPVRRLAAASLAVAALLWPAPASADVFARLADWIRAELESDGTPSLAVAVARDGQILWAEGFGYADRERRIPATPDTRYSLASASKPITATAVMALVERGLIVLDRPINDYLGDAAIDVRVGAPGAATVRRIATHTAGLPVHHHFFIEGRKAPPPMEVTIRRYGRTVSPPGARFQYSNLGYGVLGHVLGLVTGRSYAEVMRDEVFTPLGMLRSSIGIPADERDDYAVRYATDGAPLPYYDFDHDGASAVFASARDLAAFGLLHVGRPLPGTPRILSDAAIRRMQRPEARDDGGGAYGIGWQVRDAGRARLVSHGGGMPGVSTSLTLVPSARLVIVALANASSSLPGIVTERLLAELAPAHLGRAPSSPAAARPAPRRTPGRRLVGAWAGVVHGGDREIPIRLRVEAGGAVAVQLDGAPEVRLAGVAYVRDDLRGLLPETGLATEDAAEAGLLHLVLTRRGDMLQGALTALASVDAGVGFALSHWVDLRRDGGPPAASLDPPSAGAVP